MTVLKINHKLRFKVLRFYFFLSSVFLLYVQLSISQSLNRIDSLNSIIFSQTDDSAKVLAYIELAGEHYLTDPALAIRDCEAALALTDKINYTKGRITALGWLAYLYEQRGEIDKSLKYNLEGLKTAEIAGNEKEQATLLNNIAAIYKDQGKLDDALNYNQQSLEINLAIGNKKGSATSYNNIGLIFFNQGKIPDALDYYNRALWNYEAIDNKEGISTTFLNIASVYREQKEFHKAFEYYNKSHKLNLSAGDKFGLGYSYNSLAGLYEDINQLDSAISNYEKALIIREEIEDKLGISYVLKNMGIIYRKLGDTVLAIRYLEKSLSGFKSLQNKWGMAVVLNQLGAIYLNSGNELLALKYLTNSLDIAKQLGYPVDISNAASNLMKLYKKQSNWKEAFMMSEYYSKMKDSVINENNLKESIRSQFSFEYERREAHLKAKHDIESAISNVELKRSHQQKVFLIGALIMTCLFTYSIFLQKKKISRSKKTIEQEKKRSDDLLLNILPEEVAEELKEKGSVDAKFFDQVTVMFTDFEAFTKLSEKLSPKQLVSEIDYCFKAFDNIITKHNIEKIKTIGDSYMCVGGLPVENSTNAIDIVTAALEIQEFMQNHIIERQKVLNEIVEIRIGIHSGSVVAGIVGIKKFAYDIWGDTVNIASRMEASGLANKVNISKSTYELVKDNFDCIYRGKIEAKNKGLFDMYFVERLK